MGRDHEFYVKALQAAATELKKAKSALAEAKERMDKAMDHRNTVIRSAVQVGRMDKTRVAELVELGRNAVGTITNKRTGHGQPLILPDTTQGDEN